MLSKAYVEITNVCNLDCSFCHGTKRAPRFMSPEEFSAVADRLSGKVRYVYLHLMGEPLLHPELSRILSVCREKGLTVIITTNGTLVSSPNGDAAVESGVVYKVSVSLHSFEANRAGGQSLEGYVADVASYMKRCAGHGIISVMRLWNLDGDGTVGENDLNGAILALLREHFGGEWVKTRSGERIADKTYIEWGEKFDWPDPEAHDYGGDGYCYGVRDQIGILADGTVVPCCLDADGEISLGNIFESDLDTILSGDRAIAMAKGFTERKMTEMLCRRCGFARKF